MLELAPDLTAALDGGHTVLVPSAQRAVAVRLGYAAGRLAAGERAFRTPDVQSFNGWLRGQPSRDAAGRPLRRLGASEEWLLWHEAVTQAAGELALPAPSGVVEGVRQAAALLAQWRIAPEALLDGATPEASLLAQSLQLIEAQLQSLAAVGSWQLLGALSAHPPRRVPHLAGFGPPTAAQRALLAAWEQQGRPAPILSHRFEDAAAAFAAAPDQATELHWAAQWCRERLRVQPDARLLVIVPTLSTRDAEVRRVFDAALDPSYLDRGAADLDIAAYALEGGSPLRVFTPIAEALTTLTLLSGEADLSEVSAWLRGVFWAQPGPAQRAWVDVWLRGVAPPRLAVGQLLRALRAAPPALLTHADALRHDIERMTDALGARDRASLPQWCGRFAQVFAICGLTSRATRRRHSHTQQVLQRLDELLQECADLRTPGALLSVHEALVLFAQLLNRTVFEPATGDAPVTLSASLHDPIVRYDGIWLCGQDTHTTPGPVRLDPFIPVALQRAAGIPQADAARLVPDAQRTLANFARSSREFIVSAPTHEAQGELTASPLVAPYAARKFVPGEPVADLAHFIRDTRLLESFTDEPGLPWPQDRLIPGGTYAIELQSRCPFRAYAQLRLGAKPIEEPVPGITALERGRMLHRALHLLWERLGGSAGLAATRAAQTLAAQIHECVGQAATEVLAQPDPQSSDAALSAAGDASGLLALRRAAIAREQVRAARLIHALCEVESGRAPFTIHALERSHQLRVGGAQINTRIDRIDRLEDGTHAILDYKTGRVESLDWEAGSTTHPQLLVYLLAAGVPVSALAMAYLDPQKVQLRGIGDVHQRLPGVKGLGEADRAAESAGLWMQQQARWREQVEQLAADFIRGEARVDPVARACDYCHLHAFCRIAERTAASESESEDEVEVES